MLFLCGAAEPPGGNELSPAQRDPRLPVACLALTSQARALSMHAKVPREACETRPVRLWNSNSACRAVLYPAKSLSAAIKVSAVSPGGAQWIQRSRDIVHQQGCE